MQERVCAGAAPPPTAGAGLQTTVWMEVVLADG